jgi:hypothetical protein
MGRGDAVRSNFYRTTLPAGSYFLGVVAHEGASQFALALLLLRWELGILIEWGPHEQGET